MSDGGLTVSPAHGASPRGHRERPQASTKETRHKTGIITLADASGHEMASLILISTLSHPMSPPCIDWDIGEVWCPGTSSAMGPASAHRPGRWVTSLSAFQAQSRLPGHPPAPRQALCAHLLSGPCPKSSSHSGFGSRC